MFIIGTLWNGLVVSQDVDKRVGRGTRTCHESTVCMEKCVVGQGDQTLEELPFLSTNLGSSPPQTITFFLRCKLYDGGFNPYPRTYLDGP